MTRLALRALWSRKLRTVLTGLAIVLGVATISGTYVLTDSISKAFDAIFTSIYRNTDAVITGKSASQQELDDEPAAVRRVAAPEGAAAVDGRGRDRRRRRTRART